MWIFFGIVSFSAFLAYALWRKLFWSMGWPKEKGYLRTPEGQSYKLKESTEKRTQKISIAVPCPAGVSLRIHRETWWDRLAKKIGLSYEFQFNDPQFDDELYVVSNAPTFQEEMANTQALRDVIRLLFTDKRLKRIEAHGQHVLAHYQDQLPEDSYQIISKQQAGQIASALYGLADSLQSAKSRCQTVWDRFQLRAASLAALSSAILLLGSTEFFRTILFERARIMLDAGALFSFSTLCAGIILFLLLSATILWLRGSSYAHVLLAEVLISGGIGLSLGSYVVVRDINISFDQSVKRKVDAKVISKRTWSGRKSGTHYALSLSGQDGTRPIPHELEVSLATYNKAEYGKTVTLLLRNGALGYRWIVDYEFN